MTDFGNEPAGGFSHDPFGGSPFGYRPPGAPYPPPPPPGANTLATLSVVFAVIFAPVGAVLGHVALSQIHRTRQPGRGRAIVGLALSYTVITVAVIAVTVWFVTSPAATPPIAAPTTSSSTASSTPTTTTPTTTTTVPRPLPTAQSLLLVAGASTPAGTAKPVALGDTYFISVQPPTCSAALLFKNSPLIPPGSTDHAEVGFTAGGDYPLSESADVYSTELDPQTIVRDGFSAVANCNGDAVGTMQQGPFYPMHLTQFAMAGDGVVVWTMSRPDWTCDYGLAVTPHAALMLSRCAAAPGFPMSDWANTRRQQILSTTS
jgi:hypothetical protein